MISVAQSRIDVYISNPQEKYFLATSSNFTVWPAARKNPHACEFSTKIRNFFPHPNKTFRIRYSKKNCSKTTLKRLRSCFRAVFLRYWLRRDSFGRGNEIRTFWNVSRIFWEPHPATLQSYIFSMISSSKMMHSFLEAAAASMFLIWSISFHVRCSDIPTMNVTICSRTDSAGFF